MRNNKRIGAASVGVSHPPTTGHIVREVRLKLLIVDPIPGHRQYIKDAVASLPIAEVDIAETRVQAIRQLDSKRFDIMLTTTELPDGTAQELLREVIRIVRNIPPIVVYGASSDSKSHRSLSDLLNTGAFDIIEAVPSNTRAFKDGVTLCLQRVIKKISNASEAVEPDDAYHPYEIALNNAGEAILIVAPNGEITFANRAAARIYRTTPEAIQGLNVVNLIDPNHHEIAQELFNTVLSIDRDKRIRFQSREELQRFTAPKTSPTGSIGYPARGYSARENGEQIEVHFDAVELEKSDGEVMFRLKEAGPAEGEKVPLRYRPTAVELTSRDTNRRYLQTSAPTRPEFERVAYMLIEQAFNTGKRFLIVLVHLNNEAPGEHAPAVWPELEDSLGATIARHAEYTQWGAWDMETYALACTPLDDESESKIMKALRQRTEAITRSHEGIHLAIGAATTNSNGAFKDAQVAATDSLTKAKHGLSMSDLVLSLNVETF